MADRKMRIFPGKVGLPEKKPRVVKKPAELLTARVAKKRVPFSMSSVQSMKMRQRMFDVDKYNSRQKSEWIGEAIDHLLQNPHWLSIVKGVMMAQRDPTEEHIVMMEESLKLKLESAYLTLREEILGGEIMRIADPMGAIIRAAIMSRVNPIADQVVLALDVAKARAALLEKTPSVPRGTL